MRNAAQRLLLQVATLAAVALWAAGPATAQLPVVDGFEPDAYTTGSLPQGDWTADSPTSVSVQQDVRFEGQAALKIEGGATASRGYSVSDQIVYIEGYQRGVPSTDLPDVSTLTSGSALVAFTQGMGIVCLDGDGAGSGTWTQTSVTSIQSQAWYHIMLKIDYGASPPSYDVWINNQPELSGLGFLFDSTSALTGFLASAGNGAAYLDYLTVSDVEPTPDPTSAPAPEPIRHYGFEVSEMGWVYNHILPLDGPDTTSSVTLEDGGSLDVFATARESFGYWFNPSAIPLMGGTLFEGRWRVKSGFSDQTMAPSFRLRLNTTTNEYNNGLNVVNGEDAAYSPDADGRVYKQFFLPPDSAAVESFNLSFDLIHFALQTPPDTAIHLDGVTILAHAADDFDPSLGTQVANFDFSAGNPGDWTSADIPIFDVPTYGSGSAGLTIQSNGNTNCFGFWGSAFIDPVYATPIGAGADKLIRVDFNTSADVSAPVNCPDLRLRINWSNFQAGVENGIVSVISGAHSPSDTAQDYSVFVHMPGDLPNIAATDLILSFDLFSFTGADDPDATFTLWECDVTSFDL